MKLTIKREPFLAALERARNIVPTRGTRPILKACLITPDKIGNLEVQATDMEVGLRYKVKAESVDDPKPLALSVETLAKLLSYATDETVAIETTTTPAVKGRPKTKTDPGTPDEPAYEGKAVLTTAIGRFELPGWNWSDFPEIPGMGEGPVLSVAPAELAKMIDRTVFAAARERGRYAVNGVYMQCRDKMLEVVATDGRRLAYCKKKMKSAGTLEEGVIVPIKMMQEMRKVCDTAPSGEDIQIAVRGRAVVVSNSVETLSSLLVEGIFPKYQQVIPKDCDKELIINRGALIAALQQANTLRSEQSNLIPTLFTNGAAVFSPADAARGKGEIRLTAEYEGPDWASAFRPQYLLDVLEKHDAQDIRFEFGRPDIVVIREGQDWVNVIMGVARNA